MKFTVPNMRNWAGYLGNPKSEGPGLRRASYSDALLVSSRAMRELIASAPVPHEKFTVDTRVHMLMPGQYPCIPGWHVDETPRDDRGKTRFAWCNGVEPPQMFLWTSGPPVPEFTASEIEIPTPKTNGELGAAIDRLKVKRITALEGWWWEFDWLTPHRGTPAKEFGWRIFVRLIESRVLPPLERSEIIRAHSQVYLDAEKFSW